MINENGDFVQEIGNNRPDQYLDRLVSQPDNVFVINIPRDKEITDYIPLVSTMNHPYLTNYLAADVQVTNDILTSPLGSFTTNNQEIDFNYQNEINAEMQEQALQKTEN